jgi:seryl-tRNA synthetase
MRSGRRKTDTLQYKAMVSLISTFAGVIISVSSFFIGQITKAEKAGAEKAQQLEKIETNTKNVDLITKEVKEVKEDQEEIKKQVHKIDNNIVTVSTKIDFLIRKEIKREKEENDL